jgi:hypothetical protein
LIAEEEEKENHMDDKDHTDEKPDEYDPEMEPAYDESDEVFTGKKTSTDTSSSVNTKVAAVESKPDSCEYCF